MKRRRTASGLTLIEILIAVTLLSVLVAGVMLAMRVGLGALGHANARLLDNRRVAGTERILEQQLEGMMPVMALCGDSGGPRARIPFFEGQPQVMRFVSSYSIQEAWRGYPQILEFLVSPRPDGEGVRLLVNEIVYTGPEGAGRTCIPGGGDPVAGHPPGIQFLPVEPGPHSFVLMDRLASCRFLYLARRPDSPDQPPVWVSSWVQPNWPLAVRVEMAPARPDPARLPVAPVTAVLHLQRNPEMRYADQGQ